MRADKLNPECLAARVDALEHILWAMLNTHPEPKAMLRLYSQARFPEIWDLDDESIEAKTRNHYRKLYRSTLLNRIAMQRPARTFIQRTRETLRARWAWVKNRPLWKRAAHH